MPHPVLDAANRFKAEARRREASAMRQLAEAYAQSNRQLRAEILAVVESVRGREPTLGETHRLASLQVLARRTQEEVDKFASTATGIMDDVIREEIERGTQDSEALVRAYFTVDDAAGQAITAGWTRLPTEAVESLIGMTQSYSPLHTALQNRLGSAVAEQMIDQMVQGIARGKNPRAIARQVMGEGLTWTMTTVRTAQMNAYRYASHENYKANRDVVSGWKWLATLDARTCVSCLAMHGSTHGVDEVLNDHHNGRCVPIPLVPRATELGIPEPDVPSAEEWFRRRTEAQQREQMGAGKWALWQQGQIGFGDLTSTYQDPVYGTMRREPSLKAIAR
jgi:hypothetical protein